MLPLLLTAALAAEPLTFERLEVQTVEDWVIVRYAIDRNDWRQLAPHVPMRVEFADAYDNMTGTMSYQIGLQARAGDVALPLPRAWRIGQVTVRPEMPLLLEFNGAVGGALAVGVAGLRQQPPLTAFPQAPGVRWLQVTEPAPSTIVTTTIRQQRTCPNHDPAAVTAACDDAVVGSSSVSTCVATAAPACFDPTPAIRACGDAVVGSSSVIACVQRAVAYPYEPSAVIRACEDAVVGSDAVVSCVEAASGLRNRPAQAVAACGDAVIGSSDVLTCIRASSAIGAR